MDISKLFMSATNSGKLKKPKKSLNIKRNKVITAPIYVEHEE